MAQKTMLPGDGSSRLMGLRLVGFLTAEVFAVGAFSMTRD